jgi:hypothetical protein
MLIKPLRDGQRVWASDGPLLGEAGKLVQIYKKRRPREARVDWDRHGKSDYPLAHLSGTIVYARRPMFEVGGSTSGSRVVSGGLPTLGRRR